MNNNKLTPGIENLNEEIIGMQSQPISLACKIGGKLLAFYEARVWLSLGYKNPDEWRKACTTFKRSTIYNFMAIYKAYVNLQIKCETVGIDFLEKEFYAIPYSKILAIAKKINACKTAKEIKTLLETANDKPRHELFAGRMPWLHAKGTWLRYNPTYKKAVFEIEKFNPDLSPESVRTLFLNRPVSIMIKTGKEKILEGK